MPEFALFLPEDSSEAFADALTKSVNGRKIAGSAKYEGDGWLASEYSGKSTLRCCINMRANAELEQIEVVSANPVGKLSDPVDIYVDEVMPNKQAGEACVRGSLGGEDGLTIHLFMPWYFLVADRIQPGLVVPFRLCALALNAENLQETSFEMSEGSLFEEHRRCLLEEDPSADPASITSVTVDLSQMRAFLPDEQDVASFQLPASRARKLRSPFGAVIWQIHQHFLEMDGKLALRIPLHIPERGNPGYDPKANLPVRGRAWIQGFVDPE